jgi:class 3 adenylate cyclase
LVGSRFSLISRAHTKPNMSNPGAAMTTVVFADLMGSTGLFEATGNAKAARAVTRLTDWISQILLSHNGRVVKTLGDGVLAVFESVPDAVDAVVELQRRNQKNLNGSVEALKMQIRVGMALGEVEFVAGDCFGDAVNVASRLSDLSGPSAIWASSNIVECVRAGPGVRFRSLGPIAIRGRQEPFSVHQIEWKVEETSDLMTMQANFDSMSPLSTSKDVLGASLELTMLDVQADFKSYDLPITIGRSATASFVVNDPRVSREHVRVEWRNGGIVLTDTSSYGTWVRFQGEGNDLLLRRQELVLHGTGEIGLGAPFTDLSVPSVVFRIY